MTHEVELPNRYRLNHLPQRLIVYGKDMEFLGECTVNEGSEESDRVKVLSKRFPDCEYYGISCIKNSEISARSMVQDSDYLIWYSINVDTKEVRIKNKISYDELKKLQQRDHTKMVMTKEEVNRILNIDSSKPSNGKSMEIDNMLAYISRNDMPLAIINGDYDMVNFYYDSILEGVKVFNDLSGHKLEAIVFLGMVTENLVKIKTENQ